MFLFATMPLSEFASFPRVRGDVPGGNQQYDKCAQFSPRARGCSGDAETGHFTPLVFPACAGMFPGWRLPLDTAPRFPRVRGDVP